MKITSEKLNNCCWMRIERFARKIIKIKTIGFLLKTIGLLSLVALITLAFYYIGEEILGAEVNFEGLNVPNSLGALTFASSVGLDLEESSTTRITTLNTPTSPFIFTLAYDIIECESSWNPKAIGDNGKAYGLAQFHKPTWDWLCELSGKNLDYYNPNHQIKLLVWALENNRGYLWTCYNKVI